MLANPVNPADIKIAYFGNVLNNHQSALMDELYDQTGGRLVFVELTEPAERSRKGNSCEFYTRPYLLKAWRSSSAKDYAMRIAEGAQTAFFSGPWSLDYQIARLEKGLLSFEVSERWLKRGILNLLSPRLIRNLWYHHTRRWGNKPLYKLCSSAYCSLDQRRLGTFAGKCFKWGYFTKVDEGGYIRRDNPRPVIMWCGRLVDFKHPELAVRLASMLSKRGCDFEMNIFGDGYMEKRLRQLAEKDGLGKNVRFRGYVDNGEIRKEMRRSDIFILTSDRREGWGAVANESMSEGCCLVASDAAGCSGFLIEDGVTGVRFRSGDAEDLSERVMWLIEHREKAEVIGRNAKHLMQTLWSPHNGAVSLLRLLEDVREGKHIGDGEGPATPDNGVQQTGRGLKTGTTTDRLSVRLGLDNRD